MASSEAKRVASRSGRRPSNRNASGSTGGSSSAATSQRAPPASASGPGSAVASAPNPSAFFLKERERLITDIADGMEQVLGNVNTLNRKLEESVTVGQEFEPIANLWGPFVEMLTKHGLRPEADGQAYESGSGSMPTMDATARETDDGPIGNKLPLGVAPGGGTVYGMSTG